MKTKIHSCARLFALFCMLTLAYTSAWGAGAKMKVSVAASTGETGASGQVSTDGSTYATSQAPTNNWGDLSGTIYARPNRGSSFDYFGTPTGSGNPSVTPIDSDIPFVGKANITVASPTGWAALYSSNTANLTVYFKRNPIPAWDVTYVIVQPDADNGNVVPGWYSVSGLKRGTEYGSADIKTSDATFSTYNDDIITLTAHCTDDAYRFSQFFTIDAEGTKRTLGVVGTATQTLYIPEGTVEVGAEFSRPFYVKFVQSTVGGTYSVTGPDNYVSTGVSKVTMPSDWIYTESSYNFTFSATPQTANGYSLLRYYATDENGNVSTVGEAARANQTLNIKSGPVTISAEFTQDPFAIGEMTYSTLKEALQAVSSSKSKTILQLKDYVVPKGNYTIPKGAILLIPKSGNQVSHNSRIERVVSNTAPSKYRKLTLAEGVSIDVKGTIEVGGSQSANGTSSAGAGIPSGTYGQIEMQRGSSITLNDGAKLYAWGFVTGEGKIDARRGSEVYEQFQMYDWKGGRTSAGMITSGANKVFPVNQYFIQNIEDTVIFHPGASLFSSTSVYVESNIINGEVQIIGVYYGANDERNDVAMFLMDDADTSEDTWVRKSYNVSSDRQIYDINSSASLGSVTIGIAGYTMESSKFILPITNNLKIHLLSGEMDITQSTVMLPGSEIEVDKEATVTINSGQSLYLYDIAEWDKYVYNNAYAQRIKYRPGTTPSNTSPRNITAMSSDISDNKLHSAAINVHGTFEVIGDLYTTPSGANIYSTNEDAGTVHFTKNAPSNSNVYMPYMPDGTESYFIILTEFKTYRFESCPSARLKNESGYTDTKDIAKADDSYCYILDAWRNLKTEGCFVYETKANGDKVYYAKPADYVALKNGKTENADHTYSSADGSRTFILTGGCQWWEVEYQEESGLYFCEKNGIYYYYDEEEEWIPKTFKITWQNWDGSILKDEKGFDIIYEVPYGSMPKYNNSTPTRPDDPGYYTYDFKKFSPDFTPVTKDVTYIAEYEKNPVMYTIIWKNVNGTIRKEDYFQRDVMPVCSNQPADMSALEWTPAIAPVTGDATYQLQAKTIKTNYTITWKNWDGTPLKTDEVAPEVVPQYTGTTPTKPALDDMEYEFNGWKPTITAANADAIYVAQFTEKPITYTITWKNWNGTVLKTDEVAPKVVPQYTGTTPTKPAVGETEFVFANEWTPAIVAAADDATYTAVFNQKITGLNVTYARTIADEKEVSDVRITPAGSLTITGSITAQNFYLQATETESGQFLNGENKLTVNGNVYFDLTLNTPARHWHAFGVPWGVNINDNPLKEVETGRTLTLGRDYDIIYYNGTKRASQGPGAHCWEYVEDNGKTLTPGQGYMIAFTSAVQTVRFTKADGAPVIFNGSNSVIGGSGDNGGWNAIANPMAYHATLNAGPIVGYVHDGGEIGSDGYVPYDIENKKYIVGKAVYVQASAPATVAVAAAGNKGVITPVAAPARRAKATDKTYLSLEDYYRVSLADAAGKSGSVYVLPEEDKADQYVIGHDLSQFGINATKPQLWINRYGTKLALNTTAPVDGAAEFPMSLYAPAAGEYIIALAALPDDENAVYLTKDGEVIWNLSDGAYTLTLAKGTTANYGLRIGEKKAPEVATGFGEAVVDAHGKTTKVLIDGKVFIIREDRVYSIDGQLVK